MSMASSQPQQPFSLSPASCVRHCRRLQEAPEHWPNSRPGTTQGKLHPPVTPGNHGSSWPVAFSALLAHYPHACLLAQPHHPLCWGSLISLGLAASATAERAKPRALGCGRRELSGEGRLSCPRARHMSDPIWERILLSFLI